MNTNDITDEQIKKIISDFPDINGILEKLITVKVEDNFDSNFYNRNKLIKAFYKNYSLKDKKLIEYLLIKEIESVSYYACIHANIKVLAYMLYSYGDIDDIELLYKTKFETNYDLRFVIDIELIMGDDKDKTKEYYTTKNNDIVQAIKEYETRPFKSREEYIKRIEERNLLEVWIDDY